MHYLGAGKDGGGGGGGVSAARLHMPGTARRGTMRSAVRLLCGRHVQHNGDSTYNVCHDAIWQAARRPGVLRR